jgi:catechol 2,3-dioxygenase-like lactoylglutathione lyase family enzyme
MLTGFDHVTITVSELGPAVERYARLLGVGPVWLGVHPELGVRAALFGLSNALVELIAPDPGAVEADGLRALLDTRGEGLWAMAFATEDAARASAELRARGVRASAPESGEALSGAAERRTYRTLEISPRATRGLTVLAVERSDTASLREPAVREAAAADALDHIVVRTAQPEAAIALYSRGLGIRLALDRKLGQTRMLFFRIGGVTVEVVEDPALGDADAFYGLCYRVQDIDAANARLRALGFAVSAVRDGRKPNTRVFTVRDGTCSVPTLILHDPARV